MTNDTRIELVTPQIFADLPLKERDVARFQFEAYANTLARIIADTSTDTPLTIGINGEWGTGKTTLMRMIRKRLDQTSDKKKPLPDFINNKDELKKVRVCKSVWFNAWKYAGREEAMFVALIEEILREMRRDGFIKKLYATMSDPKRPGIRRPEALLSTLTKILSAGQIDIDLTPFQSESRFKTNLAFLDEFQIFFDRLLDMYVGRDKKKDKKGVLVVFIDDLDRCLPEKTVQVLETVKLFMDKPSCIFILGAATAAIESAVAAHYKTEEITGVKAKDYLDKIIQVRFELPPIRPKDMKVFIQGLELRDDKLLSSLEIITGGVQTNPRRVKTFINYLELQWALLKNSEQAEEIDRRDFTQWLVLTEAAPDFCTYIKDLPKAKRIEYITKSATAASSEGDEAVKDPHRRWMEQYPRLETLLTQKDFDFKIDADILDRFIFLSAPPVEVTEEEEAHAKRETRAEFRKRTVIETGEGPEIVLVPEGPFLMGSADDNEYAAIDEKPQHEVNIDAFRIGRYPVTNAQFERFIAAGGYESRDFWTDEGWSWRESQSITLPFYWDDSKWNQPDHPVVGVSWYEAMAFCRWISKQTGDEFRLPTEAEWEKAARGGESREWPWGDVFDSKKANTLEGGGIGTTPVGMYSPEGDSQYGISDMAGNVFEWCQDWYTSDYYKDSPAENPVGLQEGHYRVLRGGSWNGNRRRARCAFRRRNLPNYRVGNVGFRVAASPGSP